MKTLTRHLLYLASFLALLLFVAGLTLFREAPVIDVLFGVLAIIATLGGVGWLSYRLSKSKSSPADPVYTPQRTATSTSSLVDQH